MNDIDKTYKKLRQTPLLPLLKGIVFEMLDPINVKDLNKYLQQNGWTNEEFLEESQKFFGEKSKNAMQEIRNHNFAQGEKYRRELLQKSY